MDLGNKLDYTISFIKGVAENTEPMVWTCQVILMLCEEIKSLKSDVSCLQQELDSLREWVERIDCNIHRIEN